ncbi:unnamed protein product [Acanthoscelides obtectus]|uniref:Uncharacterized protein n=1 Tax=Acanthoscelides obtectus TaxID=200917 RepID=A0A9P0KWN9_ACAOB|nr:unnamed protein product [Acanthoscelides obtectus]CAK1656174.1 hypothetical protein AOBTE_LOCUS19602 [Acanthoscelides obtectus]
MSDTSSDGDNELNGRNVCAPTKKRKIEKTVSLSEVDKLVAEKVHLKQEGGTKKPDIVYLEDPIRRIAAALQGAVTKVSVVLVAGRMGRRSSCVGPELSRHVRVAVKWDIRTRTVGKDRVCRLPAPSAEKGDT